MADIGSHQMPGRHPHRRQHSNNGGRSGPASAQKGDGRGSGNSNNRNMNGHFQQSKTPNNSRRKSSNSYSNGSAGKSVNQRVASSQSHAVERRGSQDMRELTAALMQAREGAGDVVEILMCSAFRPRLPGLTKMLSKLGKDGSWKKALELYEAAVSIGMCDPDTALTNAAVSACDKGGQWQKALEYFDKFERMGIKRDAITYSATINALGKGKQWEAALKVFDHMKTSGVRADVVTCCSLINALEKSGQWEMAESLFYYMKGDPVPEDNEIMAGAGGDTGILSGLSGVGDVIGQGIGAHNQQPQPSPNSVLRSVLRHNSLISHLATVNEDNVVPDDEFGSLGFILSPDDLTGTPVSAGSDQSNASNISFSLVSEHGRGMGTGTAMNANAGRRDSVSSAHSGGGHVPQNLLMEFASLGMEEGQGPQNTSRQFESYQHQETGSRDALLRRSISCFPEMSGHTDPLSPGAITEQIDFSHAQGVHPNRVCCNALMGAFARARPTQWKKAVDFVAYLWTQDESIQPDVITYNTALKACSSAFQLKQIEVMLADMNNRGVLPNTATFQFIIEAATESHSSLFLKNVIQWLEEYPNLKDKCSSQLVVACIRCNMRSEALEIFEDRLTSNSHGISEATEVVFSGLIMHKDCDSVIRLLDLMCEMRTLPSMNICSSLIDFLCRNNHWEAAANLLENMISGDSHFSERVLGVSTVNAILHAMCRVVQEGTTPSATTPPNGGLVSASVPMYPKDQAKHIVTHANKIFQWFGTRIPCRANQETFAHMVHLYFCAEEYVDVLMMNQIMSKQGCYPDQETMSYILLASFERGDTNNAIRLMTQLMMSGVVLSNMAVSRGFEETLARGEWQLAQVICDSLEKQNAPQESIGFMYHALLRKVMDTGDNGTALKLICTLQHKPLIQLNPMIRKLINGIVSGDVFGGDAMGAMSAMSGMSLLNPGTHGMKAAMSVDPNGLVSLQQSTDSSTSQSHSTNSGGSSLFTPGYHPSLSISAQSPQPPSNRDLVNGLLDEWLASGILTERIAKDAADMRSGEKSPTPGELLDIVCRVAEANRGAQAEDAVRMCCSLHTRAGALDYYRVPNMYSRQGEKHVWQQDIDLKHLTENTTAMTAIHVIVASWVLAAQEAVSWDLGSPAFDKFSIHIRASSSEQVGKISLGLIQLLTRGHSSVIPESRDTGVARPGSGPTSNGGLPRFHDASFVTLFQQDETSGIVEVDVNGLKCLTS